ncbi:GNAT family N-acetyltransferase [Motiliproteus sp. MSK22-1]|uniref:GNAT family N-acetyltransferase n=1 Tax=Motiliproteus sp. MSK22-1 TaxID=1897630 RepID=UPI00097572D4|nr:GNAT family N-acetyltransferase [Motiliproteus sp. MSK22-1]OMH39219.1 GNAT family N-acetyltransferase [Motiliproteus sp. MSK22-1]
MNIQLHQASLKEVTLLLPFVSAYHEFEQLESTQIERESAVRKLIMNPEFGGIWLIYCDNTIAGYIAICRGYSIEFNGFDAFVDEFYLSTEFRGKGVGTQVLEAIRKEAKNLEINALHLEVARSNVAAKKFYEKAGFKAREKYLLMSAELDVGAKL